MYVTVPVLVFLSFFADVGFTVIKAELDYSPFDFFILLLLSLIVTELWRYLTKQLDRLTVSLRRW